MNRFSSQIVFSVVLLIYWGCVFGEAKLRCLEAERRALLEIKESLEENQIGILPSWGNEEEMKECCNWVGVQCANNSGHVIILDLSPSYLGYDCYSQYLNGDASLGWIAQEDFFDEAQFVWKGTTSEYKSILGLVKNIDLSSNKLMGEIPEGITELVGLVSLNLSRNNLSGQIPSEMGRLIWLDALDLSNNHFSGKIPSSFSRLDRLPVLDLSNNNLSGKIPTSTQLQSFNASAYMGNPELCGAPLAKCPGEEHETPEANKESKDEEGQDVFITKGFYVSAAIGFVIAFWGVCGSLLLIKSRRHAYFRLLNDVQDWIYVTAAVNKAKMLRMTKS